MRNATDDPDIFKLAQDVFMKKGESFEIRKSALVVVNLNNDLTLLKPFYSALMMDREEKPGFRKIAIERCETLKIDDFELKLLKLIGDQNETAFMRQIFIETLAKRKNTLTNVLPELNQTYQSMEKGPLKNKLKELMSASETRNGLVKESKPIY